MSKVEGWQGDPAGMERGGLINLGSISSNQPASRGPPSATRIALHQVAEATWLIFFFADPEEAAECGAAGAFSLQDLRDKNENEVVAPAACSQALPFLPLAIARPVLVLAPVEARSPSARGGDFTFHG